MPLCSIYHVDSTDNKRLRLVWPLHLCSLFHLELSCLITLLLAWDTNKKIPKTKCLKNPWITRHFIQNQIRYRAKNKCLMWTVVTIPICIYYIFFCNIYIYVLYNKHVSPNIYYICMCLNACCMRRVPARLAHLHKTHIVFPTVRWRLCFHLSLSVCLSICQHITGMDVSRWIAD